MFRIIVLATLRCFWTDMAIWVKSFVTLKLLELLETHAKRAVRSAASEVKSEEGKAGGLPL